ncbi:MAG: glucose-6-phosphate dehydrogenase, partial [Pseudomonadota bacterium]
MNKTTKRTSDIPESAHVPACDYVIIGGTGNLAMHKIFPALFLRYQDGQVHEGFHLFAGAHIPITKAEFAARLESHCRAMQTGQSFDEAAFNRFLELIEIIQLDVEHGTGFDQLAARINQQGQQPSDLVRPCIFYLAIASRLFVASCKAIKQAGLTGQRFRLVVEKPVGNDSASARTINEALLETFDETQIYRIDHYLGKETVQNLMALRFANAMFERQWNNNAIDHVQITVAETTGVGDRIGYYDTYGALRDMVQNHLLQLVCLIAMEPPVRFNADQVRDEKLKVLHAIKPPEADRIVFGQYREYTSELNRESSTETFVALKLSIENWRWAGVPFYLRTGKKMALRASEIVITFKPPTHGIFDSSGNGVIQNHPNRLVIRIQPDEGLQLRLIAKSPGPGGMRLFPSELALSFEQDFPQRLPDAYERLLMDIARGNQTLFMRHDEVLAAWALIDPLIDMAQNQQPILYRAGTMGPD